MRNLFNSVLGGFGRTLGRFLFYILLALLLSFIFKDYVKAEILYSNQCGLQNQTTPITADTTYSSSDSMYPHVYSFNSSYIYNTTRIWCNFQMDPDLVGKKLNLSWAFSSEFYKLNGSYASMPTFSNAYFNNTKDTYSCVLGSPVGSGGGSVSCQNIIINDNIRFRLYLDLSPGSIVGGSPVFYLSNVTAELSSDQIQIDINNSLNDDSSPDTNTSNDFLDELREIIPTNGTISNLFLIPIDLMTKILNGFNNSCAPLSIPTFNFNGSANTWSFPCLSLNSLIKNDYLFTLIDYGLFIGLCAYFWPTLINMWNTLIHLRDEFDEQYVPQHIGGPRETRGKMRGDY